ncbi:hypothetical protein [Knoellia koreensis]|uniref:Uncharacterized protein n=1 Tax=Knoellia koreensis TaxID=2730921 RepID=A0A849HD01_9MICO|nr:hypothetical protein [Knoellia sp. DB2414S]NNM44523.1 hypothetical protein [Knoellia sp. DB2414S]
MLPETPPSLVDLAANAQRRALRVARGPRPLHPLEETVLGNPDNVDRVRFAYAFEGRDGALEVLREIVERRLRGRGLFHGERMAARAWGLRTLARDTRLVDAAVEAGDLVRMAPAEVLEYRERQRAALEDHRRLREEAIERYRLRAWSLEEPDEEPGLDGVEPLDEDTLADLREAVLESA